MLPIPPLESLAMCGAIRRLHLLLLWAFLNHFSR